MGPVSHEHLAKGAAVEAAGSVRRFTGAVDAGASTALRCSRGRPVAQLASLTGVRCAQTSATSQKEKRAARAADHPALLGAPEARHPAPTASTATPFAAPSVAGGMTSASMDLALSELNLGYSDFSLAFSELNLNVRTTTRKLSRPSTLLATPSAVPHHPHDAVVLARLGGAAGAGAGNLRGGEERRSGIGARSAHPLLTRRSCLNEANGVSAVSSAARSRSEHHSAVGAPSAPTTPLAPASAPAAPPSRARPDTASDEFMENSR